MIGEPATDQESISGIINELADNYTAPETDLSDYYTKEETNAAIAGAGDIFRVHLEIKNGPGYNIYNADKTYDEILAAIQQGKLVAVSTTTPNSPYPLNHWFSSLKEGLIVFTMINWIKTSTNGKLISIEQVAVTSGDVWSSDGYHIVNN